MQSFIMNSHEVFIHIHQGCFAGTGAIVRLPQCQWSKPDGYRTISQCITITKHSKAKTVCIFLGIYYTWGTKGVLQLRSLKYNLYPSMMLFSRTSKSRMVNTKLTVAPKPTINPPLTWVQLMPFNIISLETRCAFQFLRKSSVERAKGPCIPTYTIVN